MQYLGRYKIIEQLGAGSMGAVYKARDPVMDRDVALKTILSHAIEGPQGAEFRERFFREARAAGRLAHPGIVTVFDVSEHEGMPFLVMEYVAGRTLQSILQSGERWDTDRVCDFASQLSEALDYAHQNGVVHRDIKPANILVTGDYRAKIADFGVAKLLESQVTSTGQLLGTPAFMAPEQFTGAPIDGRADLFALGVVIYWMATGDKPFTGDTILAVQYKVVHTDPVPPRKLNPMIPVTLEAVILKSIGKDPSERHQSGRELARDLRTCRARPPVLVQAAQTVSGDDPTIASTRPAIAEPVALDVATRPQQNARRMVLIAVLLSLFALLSVSLIRALRDKPRLPREEVIAPVERNPVLPPPPGLPELQRPPENQGRSVKPAPPETKSAITPARVIETPPSPNPDTVTRELIPPAEPRADNESFARGNRNLIGSPLRQKELAQSRNSARLLITSPALPEMLTLIVRADDELLFRRNATASAAPDNGRRRQSARIIPTVPLAEERLLPPGNHKIQVFVLFGTRRAGQGQEVSAEFDAGQRHTLDLQFSPEAPRGAGPEGESNRFHVTLK
jgi:tRNA A-37 threonylcarbamoyl transferase component Bud32